MTTYVQLTDEDPAVYLVRLVSELKNASQEQKDKEIAEQTKLIEAKNYEKVIENTIFTDLETIMNAQPKDVHVAFNICFHLLHHMNAKQSIDLIERLTNALKTHAKNPPLNLRLLNTLFNKLEPKSSLRYSVFVSIVDLALKTNHASALSAQLGNIEKWAADWKLTPEQTADLHLKAAEVAKACKQIDERYKSLVSYLKSMNAEDSKSLEATTEYAVEVCSLAIRSRNIQDCEQILSLNAVANLKDDKKYAGVHALLGVLTGGDVAAFTKFNDEHKGFKYADVGLSQDELLRKMRALTLCSLGEEANQISFKELQEKLQVADLSEVEQTVIEAVVAGVIEAKIDQENQVVLIQRVTPRKFQKESWNKIGGQLTSWKKNLRAVVTVLSQARQRAVY